MIGGKYMSAGAALLGTLLAASAYGQCTTGTGDYVQNDGGCPVSGVADPNGGCNVSPAAFQATGNLSMATPSFTISGTCGADAASGSRDIDWYSFTVTEGCFVNISVAMTDPAAAPAGQILIFSGNFLADGVTPDCNSVGGYAFTTCPAAYPEFFAEPGTYMCIVTTQFATSGGVPCESPYLATVSARFSTFSSCGNPAGGNCGVATPAQAGCTDTACCDRICTANPLCCDIAWDASCATAAQQPAANGGCGIFIYSCPAPGAGVANDCATSPTAAAIDAIVAFDNTNATTDGPNNGQCGSDTLKDVWFVTQSPADGNMTIICNSPTQDVVLSAYALGASSTVVGADLANNFLGCVDVNGIGGEGAILPGVVTGQYYLWRVGIWGNPATPGSEGTPGAGNIQITVERVVYTTGNHGPICDAAGAGVNLGLSSGPIAATLPQRWLAVPFTVSDPDGSGPQNSWKLARISPEGFQPGGTLNEKFNWIIWSRSGTTVPNYAADQIASGQITYPTLGANGEADIFADLVLPAGEYYLTVFASAVGNPCRASDGQTVLSNYAWFIGAPNSPVVFPDPAIPGGYFLWRSSVQSGSGPANEVVIAGTTNECEGNTAAAGFVKYTALNGVYFPCSGSAASVVYSPALNILGNPCPACPTDFNADGVTNAADLSVLLGAWNGAGGDLNGDGTTNAADLSILLGGWGACPTC
ncbi:MAG: hypothetical protein ACO3IB_05490 [Phycisphaerales bacterium]